MKAFDKFFANTSEYMLPEAVRVLWVSSDGRRLGFGENGTRYGNTCYLVPNHAEFPHFVFEAYLDAYGTKILVRP